MEDVGLVLHGRDGRRLLVFVLLEQNTKQYCNRTGNIISAQGALTFEGAMALLKRVQTPDFFGSCNI